MWKLWPRVTNLTPSAWLVGSGGPWKLEPLLSSTVVAHCLTLPLCQKPTGLHPWSSYSPSSTGWSRTDAGLSHYPHTDNFQMDIPNPKLSPKLQMCTSGCLCHISTWLAQRHFRHWAELLSLPSHQTLSTHSNPFLHQWCLHPSSGSG